DCAYGGPMIRTVLACTLVLIAACGGDSAGPPPPVVPAVPVPTRSTIAQGDQQDGLPGVRLPLRPTALVTDNSGRGVSNVPVQFFVVSGGGWITETVQVMTDADGRASTDWYMGPRSSTEHHILNATSPVGGVGFRAYAGPLEVGRTYISG